MKYLNIIILVIFSFILGCGGGRAKRNTLNFVALDEELTLGEHLAAQTLQRLSVIRNQEINEYFNTIASQIGKVSDWDGLTYKVHIINEPDINHFSLPGGHVFIFRGSIEIADNVSEIATLIAHEVTHIAFRHAVGRIAEKYAYAFAAQEIIGTTEEIAAHIITNLYSKATILDYTEDHEFMADKTALKYAWKANYNPFVYEDFLIRIRNIEATKDSPDIEKIALLRTTHPSITARINRVRSELDKIPIKSSFKTDTNAFHKIKEKLGKIPR
jgi:predicted Zn-dependent protease